jgi:hypothetical protein
MTKLKNFLGGIGILALLAWGINACATPEDKARWAKDEKETAARIAARREQKIKDPRSQFEYQVCKAAQEKVLATLIAPATATFPHCPIEGSEVASYKGDGRYEVYSYVDSQNAFGAMLRTKYWATVDIASVDAKGNIEKWNMSDFGVAQ